MDDIWSFSWKSPLEGRYANAALLKIWSEANKVKYWHIYWAKQLLRLQDAHVAVNFDVDELATLLAISKGEESPARVAEIVGNAVKYEHITHHDLVAGLQAFTASLPETIRPYVHLGLTSSDPEDYADTMQIAESLKVINDMMCLVVDVLADKVAFYRDIPIMGRTHLQLAEPTLLGYRLAVHLEQLVQAGFDLNETSVYPKLQTGAVGTCSNLELVGVKNLTDTGVRATGQTYPRSVDLRFGYIFCRIAAVLHKLALDWRLMYMEPWVTLSPLGTGSSAMPGKVNPIGWEKVCSLARLIPGIVNNLWDMAANSALERTLDDSAARRLTLPDLFMTMAEILKTTAGELTSEKVEINGDVAMDQIKEEWRAWLPSRALAWLQANNRVSDRMEAHRYLAKLVTTFETPAGFWFDAIGRPLFGGDTIEDVLALSSAGKMIEDVLSYAGLYVGEWESKGD